MRVKDVAKKIDAASSEDEVKGVIKDFMEFSLEDMRVRAHKHMSNDAAKAVMREIDLRWLALSVRVHEFDHLVKASTFRDFICREAPSLARDMGWLADEKQEAE